MGSEWIVPGNITDLVVTFVSVKFLVSLGVCVTMTANF